MMLALQLEGKHEEARLLSDKLEAIGPEKILDPKGNNTTDIWLRHRFNRGWFLLQDGKYQEGSQTLESGRFLSVYGSPPLRTDAPLYNPEQHDIRGKSVIISLEGGFGDEIIHSRFAASYKKLGAAKVYLAPSPELVSMCERIEGVDGVILRNQSHKVQHDFWIPGFSAGWIAGHTFEDFPGKPYLKPLPEMVEKWKSKLTSDKIKVGIRWAGNPKFEHQQFRRFPENFITNLSKYNELQIYSLQRDSNLVELPSNIVDLQDELVTWEDTMGAIENLDIVITSCTSIAHLSAGMGKETWIIVPVLPYHTWTYRSPNSRTSPYYDTAKLFRQTTKSKWNDIFQLLYKELEEKFNLVHVEQPNEDREFKRLNLGCGLKKVENTINVDIDPDVNPDKIVDLNKFPWPFEDNEFSHIMAQDVLEHLGQTGDDFVTVMKELYRISANGAIWEIQTPHWRSDLALNDPDHKRVITKGMFDLFNKQLVVDRMSHGFSDSLIAFKTNIDLEVVNINFVYSEHWQDRIRNNNITSEELVFAVNSMNNVADSTQFLIQIHKPGRVDDKEFKEAIKKTETVKKLNK